MPNGGKQKIHKVWLPRAVQRHLQNGVANIVIVPASKANGVAKTDRLQVNETLDLTIIDRIEYDSIHDAFDASNDRPGRYLFRATRAQATAHWKSHVTEQEAAQPVVVYRVA